MDPTVPPKADSLNTADLGVIMQTIGTTLSQAASHQAEATRTQSDANVKIAEIQAGNQLELAKLNNSTHRMSIGVGTFLATLLILLIAVLVAASFFVGRYEIATHTVTAIGGAVAGWLAGRAKR